MILSLTACITLGLSSSITIAQNTNTNGSQIYGLPHPKPKPAGTIRIAAYNVENLFDPFDDPTLQGKFDDAGMITEPTRCQAVADAIHEVDADIIGLEEIESLKCLTWFRDNYLSDMGYKYLASKDVGYYRGIECSLMSRYPITNIEVRPGISLDNVKREGPGWSPVPEKYQHGLKIQRSPLRVDIQVNKDYQLTLFVIHHKSGRDYRFQREAEAVVNNQWINEVENKHPNANIIVMGDFNAAPWDKSVRLYEQNGLVDTLTQRIIPHWKNADQTEANLYKTHDDGRVLDYIFMNSAAFREFKVGSAHVFGTLTPPEGWDWRTDPHPAGYASDHYPVIIDITPHDQP